ncbi:serine hydrolase [Microbacterium xanthum]|uniref:serine hydrolase n=1 Tax=Microbacterium xanthum TaxID=3079794 RepID=UPI002AD2728F|nr:MULTISPECIES: serine hydrolase [unclassified Microbacterium]MDZ8172945.1 serine hydrolase [Microbacterium sp. KSW-48]MDZ8200895.1 serine hydrolase [Microbacterium sp. SSW1-59]
MGTPPEPRRGTEEPLRSSRRIRPHDRRLPRRAAAGRRSFASTLAALDELAGSGAKVAVRVTDLDRGDTVLAGDDFITLPIGGLGIVPLLVEVAAAFEDGRLDAAEVVDRATVADVAVSGVWQHLSSPGFSLGDLAVLAAATGDALAANVLLERVGLEAVRTRLGQLGMPRTALLDGFRDTRGPDDAPHVALGTAAELSELFAALVNSSAVNASVSAHVAEWLSLNHDLSLVASATGLDPFSHENDEHGLLFINKTGRGAGIRSEAGVLAGPRAGVSYALIVCFDDLSIMHRMRAHSAFRVLGTDLMEYVY